MNFERAEKSVKEVINHSENRYNDDFKIINNSNIFSLLSKNKNKNIKRNNNSEKENLNKYIKYKILLNENIQKENKLKLYIKNSNELLLSDDEFKQAYQEIKNFITKTKCPVISPVAINYTWRSIRFWKK